MRSKHLKLLTAATLTVCTLAAGVAQAAARADHRLP